jgi:hypothetical protein
MAINHNNTPLPISKHYYSMGDFFATRTPATTRQRLALFTFHGIPSFPCFGGTKHRNPHRSHVEWTRISHQRRYFGYTLERPPTTLRELAAQTSVSMESSTRPFQSQTVPSPPIRPHGYPSIPRILDEFNTRNGAVYRAHCAYNEGATGI